MLARRTFSASDQQKFAALSGDRNPMHLDPVYARRTPAGGAVVHGMHLLLWALDVLAGQSGPLATACKLRARFTRFVYVGEQATMRLAGQTETMVKLEVHAGDSAVAQFAITFGPQAEGEAGLEHLATWAVDGSIPRELDLENMAESAAWLSFARPPAAIAEEFPHVAGWLGARRVAALGAASNLVGMVCPGLHSVFGGIAVDLQSAGDSSRPGLGFEVSSVDERFRMVRMRIAGSGIAGSVDSIARQPPAAQESMAALGRVVVPREFLGSTAMIVGGSRGLGELAAKLVAAGGGRAIVTYSVGKADAERVVNEIRAVGGLSECIHYDVRDAAAGQLPEGFAPTHLYYFATPVIFRHQAEAYSRARLAEFMQFYVDGFWDLVRCLHGRRRDISVFYPSSVYVAELPRAMTEYAMAKSAGEILCTKMNQSLAPLRVLVSRLPRVTTDQTASVVPMETSAPLDVLLPLLRQVQGIRDGG